MAKIPFLHFFRKFGKISDFSAIPRIFNRLVKAGYPKLHMGPLGYITTAIFSENAILSITGFQVKKDLPLTQVKRCNLRTVSDFSQVKNMLDYLGKIPKTIIV